jgi:trehalose-phosphatase
MNLSSRRSDNTTAVLDSFFISLQKAQHSVLMLDYDGTLAPFRVQPDKAVPYPGVRRILNNIIRGGRTRVVLISGRWTKDLIPLLGLRPLPEIWGSHGWERLQPDGTYRIFPFDEQALRGLAEADRWVETQGLEAKSEQKPGCLALHWRGLDREGIARIGTKTSKKWTSLARRTGLQLMKFDGGIELRVPGRNKGYAVRMILKETGGKAVVAYLGDDLTDEDAFDALKGKGLSILVRDQRRTTAADLHLKPPEELLDFLSRWNKARRGS